MAEDLSFTQRRLGEHFMFQFGSDRLTHTLRDSTGERQFSAPYETIGVLDPSTLAKNTPIQRALSVIGGIFAVGAAFGLSHIATEPWMAICFAGGSLILGVVIILFVGRLNLSRAKYTMLYMSPMPPGAGGHPIRIIHDKKHDAILGEIKARWKARLRVLHGIVNPATAPDKEIAKFSWLKEHAVITDDEYAAAVTEVRAHAASDQQMTRERTIN